MILDLMQLESSFVSTDVHAVYCTRTYVREGINSRKYAVDCGLNPGIGIGIDIIITVFQFNEFFEGFVPKKEGKKREKSEEQFTIRITAAQHSTAQHSTAQHSTAQHSTAQHSTAQHSREQRRVYRSPHSPAQLSGL
jgi:hypothetical protein